GYVWSKRGWIRKFAEHPDRWAFLKETWKAKKVNILITACIAAFLAFLMYPWATIDPTLSSNGTGYRGFIPIRDSRVRTDPEWHHFGRSRVHSLNSAAPDAAKPEGIGGETIVHL